MIFFSELIGKLVYSENQRLLGRLHDILFLNADIPQITKVVIINPHKASGNPHFRPQTNQ